MPYEKKGNVFSVKCDECNKTAKGTEDELIREWTWGEIEVNGKKINFAFCDEHHKEGMQRIIAEMHEAEKDFKNHGKDKLYKRLSH